jgi:hypothetical protein
MKRVALFLTESQIAWLNAQSDRTGAPMAEIVRRAIDAYREREERRKKKEDE